MSLLSSSSTPSGAPSSPEQPTRRVLHAPRPLRVPAFPLRAGSAAFDGAQPQLAVAHDLAVALAVEHRPASAPPPSEWGVLDIPADARTPRRVNNGMVRDESFNDDTVAHMRLASAMKVAAMHGYAEFLGLDQDFEWDQAAEAVQASDDAICIRA